MKNIQKALSKGYNDLLDGMFIEGKEISFYYLKAPYPATGPYILITGIHSPANRNTRDKDGFGSETTVDVFIYDEAVGDFGNMDLVDAIYDEFALRVIPEPDVTNVLAEGFNVTGARLIRVSDAVVPQQGKTTFEKRITIEHLIYQI